MLKHSVLLRLIRQQSALILYLIRSDHILKIADEISLVATCFFSFQLFALAMVVSCSAEQRFGKYIHLRSVLHGHRRGLLHMLCAFLG